MMSYPRAPILDEKLWRDPKRAPRVIALTPSMSDAQYYHWEELRHRQPPAGADSLDWWYALKLKRSMSARSYPELQGFGGRSLTVSMIAAMDAQQFDAPKVEKRKTAMTSRIQPSPFRSCTPRSTRSPLVRRWVAQFCDAPSQRGPSAS